jgi:hypothetical protein
MRNFPLALISGNIKAEKLEQRTAIGTQSFDI